MSTPSPGQARQADRILSRAREASESGRGRVLFLAGERGSGRTWLLRRLAATLRTEPLGFRVLTGGVIDGRFAPDCQGPGGAKESLLRAASGTITAGAAILDPALDLAGKLLDLSAAASRLDEAIAAEETAAATLLVRMLRAAAAESSRAPLVCFVPDTGSLGADWWAQLQFAFAQEISEELPLVLVLAADGPAELDVEPREAEPPARSVARSLVGRGLADWVPLDRLTREETVSWLGPASSALVSAVLEVSGGRAGVMAEVWADWRERGVVRQDEAGRWQLTGAQRQILAAVADDLSERVVAVLGPASVDSLDEIRQLLTCSAIEGRTFTAEAVALALGRSRDEVIDCLDELVDGRSSGPGLLRELGAIEIMDLGRQRSRAVWRYRFVRDLDWRTARERFSTEAERSELATRLAEAMLETYDPEIQAIAHLLVEVYEVAGDQEAAARFRRFSIHVSAAVLHAQARLLLSAKTDGWSAWDFRDASKLLTAACVGRGRAGPFATLMPFAERAELFARQAGAAGTIITAESLSVQAVILRETKRFDAARQRLDAARDLVSTGAPGTLGGVLTELARLEQKRGVDLRAARDFAEHARRIFLRLGDREGLGNSLLYLGSIDFDLGKYERARSLTEEALALARGAGDMDMEAAARKQLAMIELNAGRAEDAEAHAIAVLGYYRRTGEKYDEIEALEFLAVAELHLRRNEAAWSYATAALELRQAVDEPRERVLAEMVRGAAALELGWADQARACLDAALRTAVKNGDELHEAEAREMLEEL